MKKIAFLFKHSSYSTYFTQEGLDALLTILTFSDKIGLFFISDGILVLLKNQLPEKILMNNFVIAFGIINDFYSENSNIYICKDSVVKRGFSVNNYNIILNDIAIVNKKKFRYKLSCYDKIFSF